MARLRPNPSIEKGGQGLSPLADPHVKRFAAFYVVVFPVKFFIDEAQYIDTAGPLETEIQ
jgi:hypothetical protein